MKDREFNKEAKSIIEEALSAKLELEEAREKCRRDDEGVIVFADISGLIDALEKSMKKMRNARKRYERISGKLNEEEKSLCVAALQ